MSSPNGKFKLKGRVWQWTTKANAALKHYPHASYQTTVTSDGYNFVWYHSNVEINPKEELNRQFTTIRGGR